MNKIIKVPFLKSRGIECGQTCAAMMIKYYYPKFKPNLDELNKVIHHVEGKYTFTVQNSILLDQYGVKTKSFSTDEYKTTNEDPNIFKKWFGSEYKTEIKKVDIDSFNWMVKEGIKRNLIIRKKTSLNKIIKLFQKDFLVCFCVDARTLYKKVGNFEGHFVILTGVKNNTLLIHDPDKGPFVEYPKNIIEKAYNHPIISDDLFVAFGKNKFSI